MWLSGDELSCVVANRVYSPLPDILDTAATQTGVACLGQRFGAEASCDLWGMIFEFVTHTRRYHHGVSVPFTPFRPGRPSRPLPCHAATPGAMRSGPRSNLHHPRRRFVTEPFPSVHACEAARAHCNMPCLTSFNSMVDKRAKIPNGHGLPPSHGHEVAMRTQYFASAKWLANSRCDVLSRKRKLCMQTCECA